MVAGRPFYPRYPQDFIMAVRGWDLEMVGAYSLIVDHLNERDRHLPDDARFMAGLLNCSQQRWRKIRQFLVDHGKVIVTDDGYLTNPRFERDKADRLRKRGESIQHGHAGGLISQAIRAGQTELPLGEQTKKPPRKLAKSDQLSGNFVESHSRNANTKPNKINTPAQPPPQAPCARVRDQSLERDSSQPSVHARTHAREDPDPLEANYSLVCNAAGFSPSAPAQIELAKGIVAEWMKAGFDFERTVLPVIKAETARATEPTRTLGRFRRAIALAHAKTRPSRPAAEPILEPEREDPRFRPIRTALLGAMGRESYALTLNSVRFRTVEGRDDVMRVAGPDHLIDRLLQHGSALRTVARAHGFDDIWH